MIRRADDDSVERLVLEQLAKVARQQGRFLLELRLDQRARPGRLVVVYVAERAALDIASAQHGPQIARALAAAADQANADAVIGAEHAGLSGSSAVEGGGADGTGDADGGIAHYGPLAAVSFGHWFAPGVFQ